MVEISFTSLYFTIVYLLFTERASKAGGALGSEGKEEEICMHYCDDMTKTLQSVKTSGTLKVCILINVSAGDADMFCTFVYHKVLFKKKLKNGVMGAGMLRLCRG